MANILLTAGCMISGCSVLIIKNDGCRIYKRNPPKMIDLIKKEGCACDNYPYNFIKIELPDTEAEHVAKYPFPGDSI